MEYSHALKLNKLIIPCSSWYSSHTISVMGLYHLSFDLTQRPACRCVTVYSINITSLEKNHFLKLTISIQAISYSLGLPISSKYICML